eukprot:scaffold81925_cov76-Cyclotella_meneghiniana.AAC.3
MESQEEPTSRVKNKIRLVGAEPSPSQERSKRSRGTIVRQNNVHRADDEKKAILDGTVVPAASIDESGQPISTADKVPTRVKFPTRRSIIQQIAVESFDPPVVGTTPEKGVLKSYNRGSVVVDDEVMREVALSHARQIMKEDAPNDDQLSIRSYDNEYETEDFLMNYGLSKYMVDAVQSLCNSTSHIRVLIANSDLLGKEDGKCIEGKRKDAKGLKLPDNKRLENNTVEYELSLQRCYRYKEIQDVCYFLVDLAAIMKIPTTFQLVSTPRKLGGIGKGLRRILTTESGVKTAEDYIPLKEQVDSAIEMIEGLGNTLDYGTCSVEKLIKDLKSELPKINEKEKNVMVLLLSSQYPWGMKGGDQEIPGLTKGFIDLLNEYAGSPVIFVFFVESKEEKIVKFYDSLVSPDSNINANIRVAKGLGQMIDGVAKHNPWLNYCLPLHLYQALGICSNILSQATSRPLVAKEVAEICNKGLGGNVPISADDMFYNSIKTLMSKEEHTAWNPVSGKINPFIDVVALKEHLRWKVSSGGILVAIIVVVIAVLLK